ncbi:very short patch repair endonuclease [Methylorubrum thiocyanatum]|uniref:very short patch repair endonuclease n=1 Tax=Methylorubrum thiocyanatum TaxID=47958 RepID=UPI003666EE84
MSETDGGPRRRAIAPDPLTPAQRHLNMSRIRSRDTKPELLLRRALHKQGLRYRLHERSLPGTPDIVMRGRRAIILIHGCFWHAHDCPYGVTPASNAAFWSAKLARNSARDAEQLTALQVDGWRIATIWECALRGRARRIPSDVAETIQRWLEGEEPELQVQGDWQRSMKRPAHPGG